MKKPDPVEAIEYEKEDLPSEHVQQLGTEVELGMVLIVKAISDQVNFE